MKNFIALLIVMIGFQLSSAQWTEIPSPLNYLYGSHFINDNTGFLLTGRGYVERTSDGGMTWDSIGTPYFYSWLNVATFLNDSVGYIGGGANFPFPPNSISDLILKTTDGGLSFDSLYGTFTGSDIQAISFADEDHGMFLGAFENYKTSDGGQTLDTLTLPNNLNSTWYGSGLAYVDLQHAYAMVYQYLGGTPTSFARILFLSSDEGDTWTQLYIDTLSNPSGELQFLNPSVGFMTSGQNLMKTIDGGQSWQTLLNTSNQGIEEVHFVNGNTGFLSAQYGDTSYLYTTLDGGSNWQIELIDTNFQASSMSITEHFIYASDFNRIFKRSIDSVNVGIRSNILSATLNVYPNPSQGIFNIQFPNNKTSNYQVVNSLGQIVREGRLEKEISTLDIRDLTSGIYTLVVSDQFKPIAFSRIVLK